MYVFNEDHFIRRDDNTQVDLFSSFSAVTTAETYTGGAAFFCQSEGPQHILTVPAPRYPYKITEWANDMGFESAFVEPLSGWLEQGDVVVGISGSGNSENVLRAFSSRSTVDNNVFVSIRTPVLSCKILLSKTLIYLFEIGVLPPNVFVPESLL